MADNILAKDCRKEFHYCGTGLLKLEKQNQLSAELTKVGLDVDEDTMKESLFYCSGEKNSTIVWQQVCDKCKEMGKGKSDYCLPVYDVQDELIADGESLVGGPM
ncbi:hypothetical protein QQS21_005825 [Conoideocrella luteorostrata]|uniref:Uncharacterized protein n=1 Tax=Conoideocrella luteorostrata TaxID=1105319 RepID=A0AAJ0CRI3_9HYPO|nr:hypothetical protein QQS21_005825 [Conoideocrella luteorostrata]